MSKQSPINLSEVPALLRPLIKFIVKEPKMSAWYQEWLARDEHTVQKFLAFVLEKLAVNARFISNDKEGSIPKSGPLVIVANHPLGAVEGIILSHYLLAFRPDLKVITNKLLLCFPEFKELFIGVDILSANRCNKSSVKMMNQHLKNNGALLIFPAGTVGEYNAKTNQVDDAPWQHTAAKLALKHNAQCLPIHIEGRNERRFYFANRIHKRLRTLLLPRAMMKSGKHPISVCVGEAFSLSDIGIDTMQTATEYLKASSDIMGADKTTRFTSRTEAQIPDIGAPVSLDYLEEYVLLRQRHVTVYSLPFNALGPLADHLATQREKTFRKAGEGTGKSIDFDIYDEHYQHILAWDAEKNRLIGGYRACRVNNTSTNASPKSLYSRSLFYYDERFIKQFSGAIEVGRSFVCEEYQGDPRALDSLWQGLGAYILLHPDCHTFIGCVSISQSYAPLIRELFYDTLLAGYSADDSQKAGVVPNKPFKTKPSHWSHKLVMQLSNVSAVNKLLGFSGLDIRVPVLIRHYLSLNGRFIDFSINEGFNNSLDGLIVVDLRQAPERYLKRYLGEEGRYVFLKRWGKQDAA